MSKWLKNGQNFNIWSGFETGRKSFIHRGSFRKMSVKNYVFLRFVKDSKSYMLDYQALKG